jgi:hypothetical protein
MPAPRLPHRTDTQPTAMHPHDVSRKWRASTLKESSAEHERFIDLRRVLGEKPPAHADAAHRPRHHAA